MVLVIGFVLLDQSRPFQKYILAPKPESVTNVPYQGNGFLGIYLEPVVHMGFSASEEDMVQLIHRRNFEKASDETLVWFKTPRMAPSWWSPDFAEGSQLYTDRSKRGGEFLFINSDGTNAFYLLWGI